MSIYENWVNPFQQSNTTTSQTKTGNFETADSGLDPKKVSLYQGSLKDLKKLQTIPTNTSKEKIVATNVYANKLAASNVKLAKLTQAQVKAVRGLVQGVNIQMQGQKAISDAVGQLEQSTAQYGMGVEAFDLQHELTTTGYSAYVNEIQNGANTIAGSLEGW